jgi:hypothetical protein
MVACFDSGGYRYNPNVVILWSDDIDDVDNPTETEIEAATAMIPAPYNLIEVIGWEMATEAITIRRYGPFLPQLPASREVDGAQFVFASDIGGNDIRTLLSRDLEGYVLFLPSGPLTDYPDSPMDVFPVRVKQITQLHRLWEPSRLLVSFVVTAHPGEGVLAVLS